MKKSYIAWMFALLVFQTDLFSQSATVLDRANEALRASELDQAKSLYMNVLKTEPTNIDIYLNLGYIYELQSDYQMAVSYYQKGIPYAGNQLGVMYNKLGNSYYHLGDYENAEKMFSAATSAVPPSYSSYRDRANARVKLNKYSDALSDYEMYLSLRPDAPQRANIEKMITLLTQTIEKAEANRLAEEARKQEEAEKQRKLLESVLESLNEVSDETQNLSADSEDVEAPEIDLDIVD